MSKRVDLEIIDYDTDYLDAIDGSVTDFQAPVPTTNHAAVTPQSRGALVLPTPKQDNSPLAGALAHLMAPQQSNGQMDAYAIRHMEMMSEKSTPTERTRAKITHYAGWVAIAAIVAFAMHKAGIESNLAWVLFASLLGYGVYKVNRDENEHSPGGVERHKTTSYATIRLAEIKAQDKANERSHETFGKVVDKVYGGNHAQGRIKRQR